MKHLTSNKFAEVLNYQAFIDRKKTELSGPAEDELEDLPFPRMLQELKKELANGDSAQDLIFNGFEGFGEGANAETQFGQFLAALGAPNYVISIKAEKDFVLKKYLAKNDLEALDPENAEEQDKFTAAFEGHNKFCEAVKTLAETQGALVDWKELEATEQVSKLQLAIDQIYKKRVLLVRNFVNPQETYAVLASFAARYGIFLANVPELVLGAFSDPEF